MKNALAPLGRLVPLTLLVLVQTWGAERQRDERGDVPGWVMVTVMTATLVIAIGGIADTELSRLLRSALGKVTG